MATEKEINIRMWTVEEVRRAYTDSGRVFRIEDVVSDAKEIEAYVTGESQ